MTLWFVFALMTAAAIFAVLWPLGRGGRPQSDGSEAAVYKDQLAEIDRDVAAGLIGSSEAEAARVEISRRLLAAADGQREPPAASNLRLRRAAAVIALVGLPIVAVALYLPLGSPQLCAIFRWRSAPARPTPRSRSTIWWRRSRRIWRKIRPMAAAGTCWRRCWRGSAASTMRSRAYRNSITYNGDSAERRADLGEAIAGAAGGVVTAEAKAEFERAVALNADEVKASYFLGLAAEQDGRDRRGRVDLARDAGKGAAGCAVASAGAGGVGAGRRFRRAGAVRTTRWPRQRT